MMSSDEDLITQNLMITRRQMNWLQAEGRREQGSASSVMRGLLRAAMSQSDTMPDAPTAGPEVAPGQIWECCRGGLSHKRRVRVLKVNGRWVEIINCDGGETGTILRRHFRWASDVRDVNVGYRHVRGA